MSEIRWRSCGTGACVEVAESCGTVLVRDSKEPQGPVLTFTPVEWLAFLDGAKAGEFDGLVDRG